MVDFLKNIAEQLRAYTPYITGSQLASLIAVKGIPGPTEQAGDPPFSGSDGLALDKAFGRLGWGFGSQNTRTWFGIVLSIPNQAMLPTRDLRLVCEIVDPLAIVALDDPARLALIEAFTSENNNIMADFSSGAETHISGRHFISVEGFETALLNEASKQKAWAQLKRSKRISRW